MTDVPHRIGRRAHPGGIVVHVYAVPTRRLVDVHSIGPEVESSSRFVESRFELNDDEWGIYFVPFDGDSGRQITAPKPPGRIERAADRALPYVLWASLLFNALVLVARWPRGWWINGACVVALAVAIWSNRRIRRARRAIARQRRELEDS